MSGPRTQKEPVNQAHFLLELKKEALREQAAASAGSCSLTFTSPLDVSFVPHFKLLVSTKSLLTASGKHTNGLQITADVAFYVRFDMTNIYYLFKKKTKKKHVWTFEAAALFTEKNSSQLHL